MCCRHMQLFLNLDYLTKNRSRMCWLAIWMASYTLFYLHLGALNTSVSAERNLTNTSTDVSQELYFSFQNWYTTRDFLIAYPPATFVVFLQSQNTFFTFKNHLLLWRCSKKRKLPEIIFFPFTMRQHLVENSGTANAQRKGLF